MCVWSHISHIWLFAILWPVDLQAPLSMENLAWDSPGKNTGVVCHFLLQDQLYLNLKKEYRGFPWWFSGWESTFHYGECGFDARWENWNPASSGAAGPACLAEEPGHWNYWACEPWSLCSDICALQLERPTHHGNNPVQPKLFKKEYNASKKKILSFLCVTHQTICCYTYICVFKWNNKFITWAYYIQSH